MCVHYNVGPRLGVNARALQTLPLTNWRRVCGDGNTATSQRERRRRDNNRAHVDLSHLSVQFAFDCDEGVCGVFGLCAREIYLSSLCQRNFGFQQA